MFYKEDKVCLLSWRDQSFMYNGTVVKVYKSFIAKDGDDMYDDMQASDDDDHSWTMHKFYSGGYNVYRVRIEDGDRLVFWDQSAMSF